MRFFAIVLAPLALSACTYQAAGPETYAEADPGEAPPPDTLAGQWQVMLLDGDEPEKSLRFGADETSIAWQPMCAGQGRRYAIAQDRISIAPLYDDEPRAVCKIGLPPQLPEFLAALDSVNTVEAAPAGAIRLHGGGHVLLLTPAAE